MAKKNCVIVARMGWLSRPIIVPEFLSENGKWVKEYPDAALFTPKQAITQIIQRHLGVAEVEVIAAYGLSTMKTVGKFKQEENGKTWQLVDGLWGPI